MQVKHLAFSFEITFSIPGHPELFFSLLISRGSLYPQDINPYLSQVICF
jgi:hypothetical protein